MFTVKETVDGTVQDVIGHGHAWRENTFDTHVPLIIINELKQ